MAAFVIFFFVTSPNVQLSFLSLFTILHFPTSQRSSSCAEIFKSVLNVLSFFICLGNRKALVEKSGLVRHATSQKKPKELGRQTSVNEHRTSIHRYIDVSMLFLPAEVYAFVISHSIVYSKSQGLKSACCSY